MAMLIVTLDHEQEDDRPATAQPDQHAAHERRPAGRDEWQGSHVTGQIAWAKAGE